MKANPKPQAGPEGENFGLGFDPAQAPPKVVQGRKPQEGRVIHLKPPTQERKSERPHDGAEVINIVRRTNRSTRKQITLHPDEEDELDDSVKPEALETGKPINIPADWMQVEIETDISDVSSVVKTDSEPLQRFQRESGSTVFPIAGTNKIIILKDTIRYTNETPTKRVAMTFRLQRYINYITSGKFKERNLKIKVQRIGEHDDLDALTR